MNLNEAAIDIRHLLDRDYPQKGVIGFVSDHYRLDETSKHVDFDLKHSKNIVASSDGVIIDEAPKVVNFLYCLVSRFKHLEAGVVNSPNLYIKVNNM